VKKEAELEAGQFLAYVEKGQYAYSSELWPGVYPSMKNDEFFLESFENTLIEKYSDYYDMAYLQNRPDNDLFEICRVYSSFLDVSHIEALADLVYDDYISEKIDYETFVKAGNDLYFFTQYESGHIRDMLQKGLVISKSRESYFNALDLEADGDYITAIDLLKTVSTLDTVYYPIALERIDTLIIEIRDSVKNGD
jgi:hypothetical protein